MQTPDILCWCEEDIPPWSCFWIKEIMNPSALETPIAVVYRPTDAAEEVALNESIIVKTWDPNVLYYSSSLFVANLRADALTNGIIAVRAKNIFHALPLMVGFHWMAYDENLADPEHRWFYPRTDRWPLASKESPTILIDSENVVRGVQFLRIGNANESLHCVPVVMASQDGNWG